jgi:hypothetical protein
LVLGYLQIFLKGLKYVLVLLYPILSFGSPVIPVIHQFAQAGFPEEPLENEQAVLIHAEFSDSAGPEKAPFSRISTIVINVHMRDCKRLLATLDLGVGTYSGVFFHLLIIFSPYLSEKIK